MFIDKIGISRVDGTIIYKVNLDLMLDPNKSLIEELNTSNFKIFYDIETELQTL
jgi:hypothetical protein